MAQADQLGYEAARQQFEAAGLPFPPIPEALRDRLTEVSEWFYTTDAALTAEGEHAIFSRLQQDRLPDFAMLGQVGHGSNSWVVRYHLALRPLVLLLEYPWGNVYTPSDAGQIRSRFEAAQRLIEAAERSTGRLAADEYVVVIETPVTGGEWLRLGVPGKANPLTMAWTAADDPIAAALAQF